MNIDTQTLISLLAFIMGASAHVLWWVFKSHIHGDSKVHDEFRRFQMHVAENYASRAYIAEFRTEVIEHLRRIEDRINNEE